MSRVSIVEGVRTGVGEGPHWDEASGTLFLVDVLGQRVLRWDPRTEALTTWDIGDLVTSIFPTNDGRALITLPHGFHELDLATGAVVARAQVLEDTRTHLNDAKLDRRGRVHAVSSDAAWADPSGGVHRLNEDGSVTSFAAGLTLGNGPAWTPEGDVMYIVDSSARQIRAYDGGEADRFRVFADTAVYPGVPDGLTVDDTGGVWVAVNGAGVILHYLADGTMLEEITTPTRYVTSLGFGGPQLDELYVTSLDPTPFQGMGGIADVIGTEPDAHAGRLFRVDGTGSRGIPEATPVGLSDH